MTLTRDLSIACSSGIIAELITLPLDTTRINVQNNQIKPQTAIKNIYTNYGFKGFYRSIGPSVLRSGSATAIRLGLYQYINNNYQLPKPIVGGLCGLVSQFVSMPFDVMKSQIQGQLGMSDYKSLTMRSRFSSIWSNRGLKGFYQGNWQVAQRSMIISSIQGPVYFTLKDEILPETTLIKVLNDKIGLSEDAIIHNVSAVTTTLVVTGVVYPVDLCKTIAMNNPQKESSVKIIYDLLSDRGVRSIYRGLSVGFMRALPHFWLTTGLIGMMNRNL